MFKRVLIKLSGEFLAGALDETAGSTAQHYDESVCTRIVGEINEARNLGTQACIVIGGGNFWRGAEAPGMDRAKADHMGMLASVMNAVYLSDKFKDAGARARVMTPFHMGPFADCYNQDAADAYLTAGDVLIFAGGTGQPFFSTDTISAIRSAELHADCVLFAKGVAGVCDRDPKRLAIGETYGVYREITCRMMIRDNLTVVDMAAAQILMQQQLDARLFDIRVKGGIVAACAGDEKILGIGTKIYYHRDQEWEDNACRSIQTLTKTK